MNRPLAWLVCGWLGIGVGVGIAVSRAAEPARDVGLEFVRVTVPAERFRDVPLDGGRLVPMPLADFDRAVAALLPDAEGRMPRPLAEAARYTLAADDRGRLSGRLEFDLGAESTAIGAAVSLGALWVERAMLRSGDGLGEAVVFGIPGGRVAVKTPSAGTYACEIATPPLSTGEFRLPLVAALVTRIDLRLPESARPVVSHHGAGTVVVSPAANAVGEWRIELAGVDAVELAIVPRGEGQPRVRCWNRIVVRGRQIDAAVRIVPEGPWRAGRMRLRCEATLDVIGGRSAAAPGAVLAPVAAAAGWIEIDVPPALAGTLIPLDVYGVAEAALDEPFAVPTIRPPADRWAGGGATLVVDPAFAVAALDVEECVVVAPSAADRWPVADGGATVRGDAATIHLEQQSAAAWATVTIEARMPRLDTARVTTLELSPGAVLGRAACDVRVASGEAFVLTGRIAPEWFIDSVEAVEWSASGPVATDGDRPLPTAERDRTLDWRAIRTSGSNELRIGLAEAATPLRPLGLRITGHRRGVPIGGEFLTADLDMVRLDGETAESALVDYRVGPDAVIELDGGPMGVEAANGRLAALTEPGAPRGRIRGGDGAAGGTARLVRRRPPLHADVLVQVVARDSRITESLSFTCEPDAGAVDSVVVRVSEPLGDAVEWSLVDPHIGALYARRLEPGGTAMDDSTAGQESWLIELRPAVEGPVTFRATRTKPFTAAVAAPLAWVEGATDARGTIVVRGAGGTRPSVINRGLAERPPQIPDDRSAAVVTELSYGAAADLAQQNGEPPVVVVPPDVAEARAWVWRESTTAWCHDSGSIECETLFDIENRGRTDVTLTVPAGLRLDEVSIDGELPAFDVPSETGGTTNLPLPTGRGRVRLRVRGVAVRDPSFGVWRIDPIACAIDVPALGRDREVKVPADLDLMSPGLSLPARDGWVERLFDAAVVRPGYESLEPFGTEAGFRGIAVPPAGASSGGLFVIRRRLVSTASIVAAAIAAAVVAASIRRHPRAAVTAVVALALVAIWIPAPVATVARAAWWGGLAGLWFGAVAGSGRRAAVGVGLALVLQPSPTSAADTDAGPVRVYVTPAADGGTALVPEPLFRRLTASAVEAESVRVRDCRLVVVASGRWLLELDVDSDHGGVLTLDQRGMGVRWGQAAAAPGVSVEVSADGATARVVTVAAGFHRIAIDLLATPVQEGGIEVVTLRLPPSAAAIVDTAHETAVAGEPLADRWQCDRGDATGGWRPVASTAGLFDVSRADCVRLARSIDPRRPLTAQPEEAQSLNEVWWGEATCVVKAAFEIAPGRHLLRSVVIRADRPLEPGGDAGHPPLVPLGGGRYLVELREPAAGPVRLDLVFAMPLDDPAGVFDVPGVWLEAVGADSRTVRCSAAAGLDVTPELPAGHALLRQREGESLEAVATWRSETVAAMAGGDEAAWQRGEASDRPRARVSVRRKTAPPRIVQRLDMGLATDLIELSLDCQIDARGGPFTGVAVEVPDGAVVERVTLVGDGHDVGETVDAHVSRPAASRLLVATQHPRPGSYRLSIAAHVAGRPLAEGRLPLLRCAVADGPPLVVRWRTRPGFEGALRRGGGGAAPDAADDTVEIEAGEPAPEFEIVSTADREPLPERSETSSPAAAMTEVPLGNAVEATIVHLAIDDRGRIWGMARFEVLAAEPVVRMRFPPGMRLFDVLVDGREAEAMPVESSAWDVRLQDVRWPRSILAVFAGEVGPSIDSGEAVLLEPPRLERLPCHDVLWTIDAPAGMQVRVAEPARVIDEGVWRAVLADLRRRITGVFAAAVESAIDSDRDRLRGFAAARDVGARPALEAEWERAIQGVPGQARSRVWVVDHGLEGLTIRLVAPASAGAEGRRRATAVLVAALVAGWAIAAWRPAVWQVAVTWSWPWLIAAAGCAWVVSLRPMLPGLALLAAGAAALLARWTPSRPAASVAAAPRS